MEFYESYIDELIIVVKFMKESKITNTIPVT